MQSMSIYEFRSWCEYRRLRGSLNTGRRIEQGIGSLMYQIKRLASKDFQGNVLDFMPHEKEAEEQKPITLAEAMREWRW